MNKYDNVNIQLQNDQIIEKGTGTIRDWLAEAVIYHLDNLLIDEEYRTIKRKKGG